MHRLRSAAGRAGCAGVLLAVAAIAAPPAAAPAAAHPGCRHRAGAEVRFDGGRLLVERAVRGSGPRTVRERWWSCWRPTGRRALVDDRRHPAGRDDASLLAVRGGRFLVLTAAGRVDVHDGEGGRLTATVDQVGVVRELAVTRAGRVATVQDEGRVRRVLLAGSGTRSCLLDAGAPTQADGPLGDLEVRREQLGWFNHGVHQGDDLSLLDC